MFMRLQKKTLRVVLADDSASLRTSLSALICRLDGVDVVGVACDGEETLEQVRRLDPDVLILDLWMPKVTGVQVLKNLGNAEAHPEIIVFTSHAEDEYRQDCQALGARYFFAKLEFEKVVSLLQELRDSKVNKESN
jgi:DNA-binding NarL/FixJ family response regulator